MRAARPSFSRFAVIPLLFGALGCSGSEDGPITPVTAEASSSEAGTIDTAAEHGPVTPVSSGEAGAIAAAAEYDEAADDGLPLWPRAAPFEVAAEQCVVTTSRRAWRRVEGAARGSGAYVTTITYARQAYDAELRVLSEINLDNRGNLSGALNYPDVNPPAVFEYRQLDETGRLLARISQSGLGPLVRTDFGRDEQHNLVSRLSTYVDEIDFETPRAPAARQYTNTYDAGLLVQHVGDTETFSYAHDADGRCERITSTYWIEQREYDANGRLAVQRFDATDLPIQTMYPRSSYQTGHRYDAQGREIVSEQDGGGMFGEASDGDPDVLLLHSYQEDGSVVVQYTDFLNDSTNDMVERHGQLRSAVHWFEVFSPGCQALQAGLPVPGSQRCITD
jgi:hypothetical protein